MGEVAGVNEGGGGRVIALEALRGWAALTVVFGHCSLAFFGPVYRFPMPIVALVFDNSFAVPFFFTLSGFVLTKRYFETLDPRYVVIGVLKRWPRLAFLTVVACVACWALKEFNLFWYHEGSWAVLAPGSSWTGGSHWLAVFGGIETGPPFPPDLPAALAQGAVRAFLFGEVWYDPPMWTMNFEFYGSFLAFGLTFLIGGRSWLTALVAGVIAFAGAAYFSSYYCAFVTGALLSYAIARTTWRLPIYVATPVMMWALLFHSSGTRWQLPTTHNWGVGIAVATSLIAIAMVSLSPGLARALSGRLAAFVGRISFPVYLMHFLVLMSLGCRLYALVPQPYSAIAATAATVIVSILVSVPLAIADRSWLGWLNVAADGIFAGLRRLVAGRYSPALAGHALGADVPALAPKAARRAATSEAG